MENQFQSFSSPMLFTSFLFILMVLKLCKRSKSKSKLNLPPGPPKLPIIGNIHQFLMSSSPHKLLSDLAIKYGSIMHLQLGEIINIVVTCPQTTKEIFKTHDLTFAQRPSLSAATILTYGSTDIVFAPYSEYWRQLRKISILEMLSAKRVQSFRSIREEEGLSLVVKIASYSGEPFNFSRMVFDSTCGIVARAVFGGKCRQQEEFRPLAEQVTRVLAQFNIIDLFPSVKMLRLLSSTRSLRRLHQELNNFFENVINDRRNAKVEAGDIDCTGEEDNILDVLLRVQSDGDLEFQLTDDNIKAVILDVFTAGSESSSTTVEWAMAELVKNPRVMRKAQEEVRRVYGNKGEVDESEIHQLHYLKLVVKESLRLHPPAPLLLPRECRESCKIRGFDIPIKSHVMVNLWAMGRDSSIWEDPHEFYPERFADSSIDFKGNDFQFIPFGAGRRICPGMMFALANVELSLARFLYHFDWKIPNGLEFEDLDMDEAPGLAMRRKHDLQLIAIPHFPN